MCRHDEMVFVVWISSVYGETFEVVFIALEHFLPIFGPFGAPVPYRFTLIVAAGMCGVTIFIKSDSLSFFASSSSQKLLSIFLYVVLVVGTTDALTCPTLEPVWNTFYNVYKYFVRLVW